ncbi:hypothetical protein K8I28_02120 [bacterium]|nr:hypothetical protein [bacterium]
MLRTGIPMLLLALVLAVGTTFAQDDMADTKTMDSYGDDPQLQKMVTIDADDAALPTVLSILAAESGYNIVTGPGVNVQDKISVHLQDTPIEEAMNLVVRAAGLSYEVVGNSFLVADSKKLREEVGLTSYVIDLQYARAEDIASMLENFNATINIDVLGNRLLVITSPKVKNEITSVIKAVDKPPLQVMIEAMIIEVAVEDEEKIGIQWNKLTPFESTIYEGSEAPAATRPGSLPQSVPFGQVEDLNSLGFFGRQQPIFQLAIDYLLKNNLAEVLANSEIATMNNTEANISVVDRIPYILSAGGVGGQVRTQVEEVGIILTVTPSVNKDGYITTTISPEVSNVFQLVGPDQNIPWVVSRSASSVIRVKDGETIIIAGLLKVDRNYTIFKVPFLGDIPFVGGLFRHKSLTENKKDLIIQITPHIIKDSSYTHIEKSALIQHAEKELGPDADKGEMENDEDEMMMMEEDN